MLDLNQNVPPQDPPAAHRPHTDHAHEIDLAQSYFAPGRHSPEIQALLADLEAGNLRYVNATPIRTHLPPSLLIQPESRVLVGVLHCSDSRDNPKDYFDRDLLDLDIRVAGNMPIGIGETTSPELAALERAVLDARLADKQLLLLTIGHSDCGAVKTAAEVERTGKPTASEHLAKIVAAVLPGIRPALDDPGAAYEHAASCNACAACSDLLEKSELLRQAQADGVLVIVPGLHELHSGKVELPGAPAVVSSPAPRPVADQPALDPAFGQSLAEAAKRCPTAQVLTPELFYRLWEGNRTYAAGALRGPDDVAEQRRDLAFTAKQNNVNTVLVRPSSLSHSDPDLLGTQGGRVFGVATDGGLLAYSGEQDSTKIGSVEFLLSKVWSPANPGIVLVLSSPEDPALLAALSDTQGGSASLQSTNRTIRENLRTGALDHPLEPAAAAEILSAASAAGLVRQSELVRQALENKSAVVLFGIVDNRSGLITFLGETGLPPPPEPKAPPESGWSKLWRNLRRIFWGNS